MGAKNWLDRLAPIDRQVALRWLREVGEARFIAIAKAAATKGARPRGAPPKDSTDLVNLALVHWLSHPGMDAGAAASAVARHLKTENRTTLGRRAAMIKHDSLQRLLSEGIKTASHGAMEAAAAEVDRFGLDVREDAEEWHRRQRFRRRLAAHAAAIQTPPSSIRVALQARSLLDRYAIGFRAFRNRHAANAASADRTRRLCLMLDAVDGLVPSDTPISQVAIMFDDLVAVLKTKGD